MHNTCNFKIHYDNWYYRPDYISPLDDLAFDMYQDPEIAGIIRKLEKKKQEAVLRMYIDNEVFIMFRDRWYN